MKHMVWIVVLFSVWLHAMPDEIMAKINRSVIAQKDLSVYIKEAGKKGEIIGALNAEQSRTPASVIKVLTTYAAVLKLGFDYRWPTKVYMEGNISQGVLEGNLIVKGFGDPTLKERDLAKMIQEIKAHGITKITGDIVIDRSYFDVGTRNSSLFDANIYSAYNAMPDAMMFNERISTVCLIPKKHQVRSRNGDESYQIVDELQYVNQPCKGRYSWPGVKIERDEVMPKVFLQGSISQRCGIRNMGYVLTKPYKSFYYALKEGLEEQNISYQGKLRVEKVPEGAKELFTHYSRSLEKIISKTAKKSNNLYARHILLLLGAKVYGAPATLQKGRDAVAKILRDHNALRSSTFMVDNGCGLSRIAKVSAKDFADMFDHAYDHYGERWMKTLSIGGVDGTIRRRFRNTIVKNHAWMKTGTLNHVKNIGGYVENRSGKRYTVVIIVNSPKARYNGALLQNQIIQWLSGTTAQPTVYLKEQSKASADSAKKEENLTAAF